MMSGGISSLPGALPLESALIASSGSLSMGIASKLFRTGRTGTLLMAPSETVFSVEYDLR